MKKLLFSELFVGMEVMNSSGVKGIITECNNPHDVIVDFENGDSTMHCVVPDCIEEYKSPSGKIYHILMEEPLFAIPEKPNRADK